jgi:hypothetical protein
MINKDFQNGFIAGAVSGGVVEVEDTTKIDALEDLIDNSGVLEDTGGTATEKVEQLIDKVKGLVVYLEFTFTNANGLFKGVSIFPNKAVVNLPNATNIGNAFSSWTVEPIPIVEELTVNAPNIDGSINYALSQTFSYNYGVKKIVLNLPDGIQGMQSTFAGTKNLKELVLNFSTKNNKVFNSTFYPSGVEKIIGVLDFSSATTTVQLFRDCGNLEEVRFEPNTLSLSISLAESSKLTSESVQSIIDGLATVETAQTLTLNQAIVLTDEQKATINAKGWTLAQ